MQTGVWKSPIQMFGNLWIIAITILQKIKNHIITGRNGDALVNCYESRSEAASTRYYRYKRNGNFTEPEPQTPSVVAEVASVVAEAPATEEKTEEKKE